jgi:hypothetical protein
MRNLATAINGGPRRHGRGTHARPGGPRRGGALGRLALVLAFGLPATAALAAGPPLEPQDLDPARPANPGTEALLRFELPDRSGRLEGLETSLARAAGARRGASLDCRSARELPVAPGLETALSGLATAEHRSAARRPIGEPATGAHQAPSCHPLCTLVSTASPACAGMVPSDVPRRSTC